MRQDDSAEPHSGVREAHERRGDVQRTAHQGTVTRERRGLPGIQPVPLDDRQEQHRACIGMQEHTGEGKKGDRGGGTEQRQDEPVLRLQAKHTVRWDETEGGHRKAPRDGFRGIPDG